MKSNEKQISTAGIKKFAVIDFPVISINEEFNQIENNPLIDEYNHYSRAIISSKNLDFVNAIKEYYQIIENNKNELSSLKKYLSLRNVLSHGDKMRNDTIDNLIKDFNGEFVLYDNKFDYNDLNNY